MGAVCINSLIGHLHNQPTPNRVQTPENIMAPKEIISPLAELLLLDTTQNGCYVRGLWTLESRN